MRLSSLSLSLSLSLSRSRSRSPRQFFVETSSLLVLWKRECRTVCLAIRTSVAVPLEQQEIRLNPILLLVDHRPDARRGLHVQEAHLEGEEVVVALFGRLVQNVDESVRPRVVSGHKHCRDSIFPLQPGTT